MKNLDYRININDEVYEYYRFVRLHLENLALNISFNSEVKFNLHTYEGEEPKVQADLAKYHMGFVNNEMDEEINLKLWLVWNSYDCYETDVRLSPLRVDAPIIFRGDVVELYDIEGDDRYYISKDDVINFDESSKLDRKLRNFAFSYDGYGNNGAWSENITELHPVYREDGTVVQTHDYSWFYSETANQRELNDALELFYLKDEGSYIFLDFFEVSIKDVDDYIGDYKELRQAIRTRYNNQLEKQGPLEFATARKIASLYDFVDHLHGKNHTTLFRQLTTKLSSDEFGNTEAIRPEYDEDAIVLLPKNAPDYLEDIVWHSGSEWDPLVEDINSSVYEDDLVMHKEYFDLTTIKWDEKILKVYTVPETEWERLEAVDAIVDLIVEETENLNRVDETPRKVKYLNKYEFETLKHTIINDFKWTWDEEEEIGYINT